jgi:outer membrane protein assembly factor BamB
MFTGTHLISLNPDNGALHWRFEWKTDHLANVATPLLFPDHVFISSGYGKGCALVRVDRDGDKLTVKQVFKNKALHNHFSSSIYHRDHVYGFDEGFLVCLPLKVDPKEKMKPRWKERKFHKGTLLLVGDHLVILGERGLLALAEASPDGYREKASFQATEGKCWSAVVLAHGRIYVRDENRLLCFDARKK